VKHIFILKLLITVKVMKSRRLRWSGHIACMSETCVHNLDWKISYEVGACKTEVDERITLVQDLMVVRCEVD
jgi:hypothetical protein